MDDYFAGLLVPGDPVLDAVVAGTVVQTAGAKGYDGFAMAVVVG